MERKELIHAAKTFIRDFYIDKVPGYMIYHNYQHALELYDWCIEIGENCQLGEEEMEILALAALFLETGFSMSYESYQDASTQIAETFLSTLKYPAPKIERVKECMLATKLEKEPEETIHKILCDAAAFEIGKKGFRKKTKILKEEMERAMGKEFSDEDWYKKLHKELSNHDFYTEYARYAFRKREKKNRKKIKKRVKNLAVK